MTSTPDPFFALTIDAAGNCPSAALARGSSVVGSVSLERGAKSRSASGGRGEPLPGAVADLLGQAGLSVRDLAALVAVTGPGSFTGLRVGLSLVRGLALLDEIPVIGFGALGLVVAGSHVSLSSLPAGTAVCGLLPAGRNTAYFQWFRGDSGRYVPVSEADSGEAAQVWAARPPSDHPYAVVTDCVDAVPSEFVSAVVSLADAEGRAVIALADPGSSRVVTAASRASAGFAAGMADRADRVLPTYAGPVLARPNRNRVVLPEPS